MIDYASKLSSEGPLILLFYGVVKKNNYAVRNCIRKHIEVDYFRSVLNQLDQVGHALSMDELVAHRDAGQSLPEKAFVVTFDDGFENNFSVAAPVLEELNIPATFYITSDFIENGTMSWTDKIEYCLEVKEEGSVKLPWESQATRFASPKDKVRLMQQVRRHVFADNSVDVNHLVDDMFKALDVTPIQTTDDPLDKKLSWHQVKQLNEHPLFTIGGHTHTHAIMSFVPIEEMMIEVDTNLNLLKEHAGVEARHFAYPQGQANHFNEAVIETLKQRGIVCCPTAIEGQNTETTDLFHLYRTMVV